jgi:GNAT superfamily N-acetyltransferase
MPTVGYRSMGSVPVREALPSDWEAVNRLLVQLGRPSAETDEEHAAFRRLFEEYLERDDAVALVAELDGAVRAFVNVELRSRLNFTSPQAWMPEVIVDETTRGRGLGAALLSRAEEVARDRGCWGMSLESANWRVDAHRFYVREGWTDSGHAFSKSLSDRPWPPPPPEERR